jgi:two-component sensor histidine kinase
MLHELNHRVKNTLATVQALARQSRGAEGVLEARILALSKTHDLLTREDWSGASLREVLESELSPYRTESDQIALDGPDVALSPRHVLALGMTIHELTTNAGKYGALSVPEGHVRVAWSLSAPEGGMLRLRLTWQESGGPPVQPPARAGFGTRLISGGVRRELDGLVDLAFEAGGLRCHLDVPLEPGPSTILVPTQ